MVAPRSGTHCLSLAETGEHLYPVGHDALLQSLPQKDSSERLKVRHLPPCLQSVSRAQGLQSSPVVSQEPDLWMQWPPLPVSLHSAYIGHSVLPVAQLLVQNLEPL